jgi:DNA processing protein
MDDQILAWVCLALTPNVGPKTIQKLREQNLSPKQVFSLSQDQLEQLKLDKKSIKHIISNPLYKPAKAVEDALQWASHDQHHLITLGHDSYPDRLKQISTAPPLLMVMGDIECLSLPQLAIVGSRYPTASGQSQAFEFAQSLTELGLVITSGLARGIDGFAHKGALQGGGKTIAVLGTGLNEIYPKQHKRLAEEIAQQGAVISEFPLHAKGLPGHFPRRNRIVSGLSLGTLVVEATLKSGSLITARQALEQNREVFAIPGPISNPQKSGCHYLIRQGASLVEFPEQIVQELSYICEPAVTVINNESLRRVFTNELPELPVEQFKLLNSMDYEGMNLDDLVGKTCLSVAELSVMLMDLELSGLIRQEQGMYCRT